MDPRDSAADAFTWAALVLADLRPTDRVLVLATSSVGIRLSQAVRDIEPAAIVELLPVIGDGRWQAPATREPGSCDIAIVANLAEIPVDEQPKLLASLRKVMSPGGRWLMLADSCWRLPGQQHSPRGSDSAGTDGLTSLGRRRGRTLAGYLQVMERAGLPAEAAWAAVPEVERPSYLMPIEIPANRQHAWREAMGGIFAPLNRSGWRQQLKRSAAQLARWRWGRRLSGGYVLTGGGKPAAPQSWLQRYLCSQGQLEPLLVAARRTQSLVIPVVLNDGPPAILKLATGPAGRRLLTRQAELQQRLSARPLAGLKVPYVLEFRSTPQTGLLETRLEGVAAGRAPWPLQRMTSTAIENLLVWQPASRHTSSEMTSVDPWEFRATTAAGGSAFRESEWFRRLADALPLAARVEPLLRQLTWRVLMHGDYHLGNVLLIERGRRVSGTLDWDLAAESGWPAVDLVQWVLSVMLRSGGERAEALAALSRSEIPWAARWLEAYTKTLDLPWSTTEILLLYAWSHLRRASAQAEWLADQTTAQEALLAETTRVLAVARALP